jgi:hypothetical protein
MSFVCIVTLYEYINFFVQDLDYPVASIMNLASPNAFALTPKVTFFNEEKPSSQQCFNLDEPLGNKYPWLIFQNVASYPGSIALVAFSSMKP